MGIDDLVLHPISTGWWVIKAHICILFSLNTVNKSNVHSLRRFWFNLKVETANPYTSATIGETEN